MPCEALIVNHSRDCACNVELLWYADAAYSRRNRLGGINLIARHALEGYLTNAQRQEHPDWNAEVNGKHSSRANRTGAVKVISSPLFGANAGLFTSRRRKQPS